MAYVIDQDLCIQCGACEPECEYSAISEVDGTYVIAADLCTNDGVCVESCPVEAINPE